MNTNILRALAVSTDTRVVNAYPLMTQGVGDIGEQAGTIGADQAQARARCMFGRFEIDSRRDPKMPEVSRLPNTVPKAPLGISL